MYVLLIDTKYDIHQLSFLHLNHETYHLSSLNLRGHVGGSGSDYIGYRCVAR